MTLKRILLVLLLASFSASCGGKKETAQAVDVPVFVISIDTLRADRLPAYGYTKGSTPALDAFRRDAILFQHAYAQVPLTLPSHASLFTGALPYEHGVRNNLGYTLDAAKQTVASLLKANGYETGGSVSSFVLRKDTGIAAGFDFYDDYMTHSPLESATSWQRDGELSRQALAQWLESTKSARVFGFLHLYEPHSPYAPPAEFGANRDPYDGEIAYADAIVGRFLEDLKRRGLYDSSLIVILSDHGEGLGDHGEKEHGIFVYRESIQVPLLVKLPNQQRKGETVARNVGLTDVLPTIVEVTGLPNAPQGVSLLAADVPAARPVYSESYYPRLQYGWHELKSFVASDVHYIDAPRVELYRHRNDPAEKNNVAGDNRREVAAFREQLRGIEAAHPFAEPKVADPEDEKKLMALGYVGSSSSSTGSFADPKDKLDVLNVFGSATDHFRAGRYAQATSAMEALMRDNPDFTSGWGLLAQSYRKLGRHEQALQALRTQMNQTPGNAQVALAIADLLMEMKRYGEAREHALLAQKSGGAFVHETLAMIAIAAKDLATAEKEANASLSKEPDRIQALMLLSEIRRKQGQSAEELAMLNRASEVVQRRHLPPIRDLEFRRGEALLQAGRAVDAEAAFRRETTAFPANLHAWANLALVVGAQGRRDEARKLVGAAIEHNPGAEARRLGVEVLRTMNDEQGAREVASGSTR
jgi:choline-sulfatase